MTEIISDPTFATLGKPSSPWGLLTHRGALMTPSVKDGVLSLDVSKTSGANWHGELSYSPFPVKEGEMFTVTFSAKATYFFSFSVWLGMRDEPHLSLVTEQNHFGEKMMAPEWQMFTHTWKAIADEPTARLNFVLGQIDNLIEIKDVSLKKSAA